MLSPDYYLRGVNDIDLDVAACPRRRHPAGGLGQHAAPSRQRRDSRRGAGVGQFALGTRASRCASYRTTGTTRVSEVAEELGIGLVAKAVKPLPFAFLRALRKLGSKRSQAAVVGDQMFTDVARGQAARHGDRSWCCRCPRATCRTRWRCVVSSVSCWLVVSRCRRLALADDTSWRHALA